MQVLDAASHFEKVERVVGEFFRGGSGKKRAVVEGAAVQAPQPGGDGGTRILVLHVQLDQRSKPQAQARGVSLGESRPQQLEEKEARLEIGASGRVFDPADAVAKVQLPGMFCRSIQQTMQAPAKVGGLADVRLRLGIFSAQKEYSRCGRDSREYLGVVRGNELSAGGEHGSILRPPAAAATGRL